MLAGANTWTLDWLTMSPERDRRDVTGVQWICTKETGFWGSPATSATLTPRLSRHGAYRGPGWKKQRTISLTGRAYAADLATLRAAEANVCGLLADPSTPGRLTCVSEIGTLTCSVYLDADIVCTPVDVASEPGFEFSLQMVAPDPAKYSIETQMMTTGLPLDAGDGLDFQQIVTGDSNQGLYFNFGDGLKFGTSNSSGFMSLTNRGTAPTTPIYTLHGPLTSPTLTVGTATMRYNAALAAGEFVVIDPSAPWVLLGGTAARRQLLNPAQFGGFSVPPAAPNGQPGVLSVGLTHTGAITDTGYVEAVFRSAWF